MHRNGITFWYEAVIYQSRSRFAHNRSFMTQCQILYVPTISHQLHSNWFAFVETAPEKPQMSARRRTYVGCVCWLVVWIWILNTHPSPGNDYRTMMDPWMLLICCWWNVFHVIRLVVWRSATVQSLYSAGLLSHRGRYTGVFNQPKPSECVDYVGTTIEHSLE